MYLLSLLLSFLGGLAGSFIPAAFLGRKILFSPPLPPVPEPPEVSPSADESAFDILCAYDINAAYGRKGGGGAFEA